MTAATTTLTITRGPVKRDEPIRWVVKRGDVFLAVVGFDGPRGTIVTYQGELYADERKEVYRLYHIVQGV